MANNILDILRNEVEKSDFNTANISFKRRLQHKKILFLDELKHMAISDSVLYRRKRTIQHSFGLLKQFIGDRDDLIDILSLSDFASFGLLHEDIQRLAYLAYQYDLVMPMDESPCEDGPSDESEDLFYNEDDVNMNPKLIQYAFRNGLLVGRLTFLEELKQMALNDYELEDQQSAISDAFLKMSLFIGSYDNLALIEKMELKDWFEFGLDNNTIDRIGYLAYQYRRETELSQTDD